MRTVPWLWPQSRTCTTRLSESTVARRVRSANGSRIDGRNRLIASVMCVASRSGKRFGIEGDCRVARRSGRSMRLERHPVTFVEAPVDDQARGLEGRADLGLAVD